MQNTYILVKDHLEQAQAILSIADSESRQLRKIIGMMIGVIDEMVLSPAAEPENIITFPVIPRPKCSRSD